MWKQLNLPHYRTFFILIFILSCLHIMNKQRSDQTLVRNKLTPSSSESTTPPKREPYHLRSFESTTPPKREPYHLRSWKSSAGAVLLIWAVRSFINGYDLTVINSPMHQNSCLDFPTAVVISLQWSPHRKYPQRLFV
jgi:hypothetical protein